jgi:hypothetical protein
MPGRLIALTRLDVARYSDLLVEAFPDIWFLRKLSYKEQNSPEAPSVKPTQSLATLYEVSQRGCDIEFGANWKPEWELGRFGWSLANWKYPDGEFELGTVGTPTRIDASVPESMWYGRIYFRVDKDDKVQAAMARKALGLLRKIASNRTQTVAYPSLQVLSRNERGGMIWIGEDAARWCREKPYRMIAYQANYGSGLRPLD